MLTGLFSMPISFLLPNFFNYKFWNNKYIWNLKIYEQSYKMHFFCNSFKKSELAKKNHFMGGHGVICRCVGYYGEEDAPSWRLARPLVFCRTPGACPLENGYARPVEGIHVLVDMRQMKVESWTNLYAIFAESLLALNIFFCGYY
jgi:hypothetical protein